MRLLGGYRWGGLFLFFLVACAPPTNHYLILEDRLAAHDPLSADATLQKQEKAYRKEDRLLYLMDRGMTLSLSHQYEASNQMLDQAAQTAEKLYTQSLTRHGAALLTNDYLLPYGGEDYERVMIHLISALNYAQLGQHQEALVECRRVDTLLNAIRDQNQGTERGYQEDAFVRYFSGVLYESAGEINDAFIAYRNAYEIYQQWSKTYKMAIPSMLASDLLRTTDALHLTEEHDAYKKQFPETAWTSARNGSQGEIVIVSLHGKSPKKEDQFFDILLDKNILNTLVNTAIWQGQIGTYGVPVLFGQWIRIAFPVYRPQKSEIQKMEVQISGPAPVTVSSTLMSNITAIAERDLSDRIVRIRTKAIARSAAKAFLVRKTQKQIEKHQGPLAGIIVGTLAEVTAAATEVTDKRSWRTLPGEIHITRIRVPAASVGIRPQFMSHQNTVVDALPEQTIRVAPREIKVMVVRAIQ
jgi:hypothetical protein